MKGKREVRVEQEERKHGKERGGTVPGGRERRQGLRESEEDLHSSGSKREEEALDPIEIERGVDLRGRGGGCWLDRR